MQEYLISSRAHCRIKPRDNKLVTGGADDAAAAKKAAMPTISETDEAYTGAANGHEMALMARESDEDFTARIAAEAAGDVITARDIDCTEEYPEAEEQIMQSDDDKPMQGEGQGQNVARTVTVS